MIILMRMKQMRIKYLLFVLSVLSVFLGILLLTKKDTPLKIITSPKMFSMIHSGQTETFTISILSNKQETYHFDMEYIDSISLHTTNEIIPLSIEEIYINDEGYDYDDMFYVVELRVKIGFVSEEYILNLEEVDMVVEYTNNTSIKVYIGDVFYVFDPLVDQNLSLSNLSATYTDFENKRTVSGVYLELLNKSNDSITITNIDIISNQIHLNNDYRTIPVIPVEMFSSVEEITGVHEYSFKGYAVEENTTVLLRNNSVDLYIPVVYQGDISFIHRFALQVTYEIDGESYQMYIDDFPYMNTSIFTKEYESNFRHYNYDSYS